MTDKASTPTPTPTFSPEAHRFGGESWVGFFQRPWGSIGNGWVQPRLGRRTR
ncbi:hypothetical protein [Myceligenerans halotolerans]